MFELQFVTGRFVGKSVLLSRFDLEYKDQRLPFSDMVNCMLLSPGLKAGIPSDCKSTKQLNRVSSSENITLNTSSTPLY